MRVIISNVESSCPILLPMEEERRSERNQSAREREREREREESVCMHVKEKEREADLCGNVNLVNRSRKRISFYPRYFIYYFNSCYR